MLHTRPMALEDDGFQYGLYASTRVEEMEHWGWDEKTVVSFLRMQWLAQTQSYASRYPGMERLLLLVDGQKAGRLLLDRSDVELSVVDFSFLPAYRGQGYGSALLRGLQKEAAQAGLPIRLSVGCGNPAKRLYERLGFRVTETDGVYEQMEWREL